MQTHTCEAFLTVGNGASFTPVCNDKVVNNFILPKLFLVWFLARVKFSSAFTSVWSACSWLLLPLFGGCFVTRKSRTEMHITAHNRVNSD